MTKFCDIVRNFFGTILNIKPVLIHGQTLFCCHAFPAGFQLFAKRRDISIFRCKPLLTQSLGDLQVKAEELAANVSHTNILTFVPTS